MANTCQASLRPAGALASSDQFVGSRAWDHKPSSTPKLNAGKIDQKKKGEWLFVLHQNAGR